MASRPLTCGLLSEFAVQARRLWHRFDDATLRRPLMTKCVVGAGLTVCGDTIVQHAMRQVSDGHANRPHDVGRSARLMSWRAMILVPAAHYWFNFMDRFLVGPAR